MTGNTGGEVPPDASGNLNVLGSGNISVDGNAGTNTETITLVGTTNHAVQVGNASGSLTSIGTGSSGQILQSAGASSDPAYTTSTYPSTNSQGDLIYGSAANTLTTLAKNTNATRYLANTGTSNNPNWDQVNLSTGVTGTLTVPNGGTGDTSFTPYSVVCGGTSNTGPLQQTATGSTGQVLQSAGASAVPTYSTATYPSTTTINQILYSSAANTVAGLSTANRAVLTTGATGIPALTALATDGQLIIGSTAGAPAAATLTAGMGVSITNGSNSITIATTGGGITWTEVTGTSQNAAVNNGYVANNAGLVTVTLPANFAIGDIVRIAGLGAGLWRLTANTGDVINFGNQATSAGGSLTATNRYDCVEVVGVATNSTWVVLSSVGNLTVA